MPNTISKINGYDIKDNVSGYTTNTGTVTGVTAGTGLSGGTVSTSGTISLDTTRALTASDIATGTDTTNKLVSAKTIADVLRTACSVTDVQINGTSILSSKVANLITNTAYNSSTNKIATMSDIPSVPTTVTLAQLQTGTDTTGYLISPKVLADYIASLDATNTSY